MIKAKKFQLNSFPIFSAQLLLFLLGNSTSGKHLDYGLGGHRGSSMFIQFWLRVNYSRELLEFLDEEYLFVYHLIIVRQVLGFFRFSGFFSILVFHFFKQPINSLLRFPSRGHNSRSLYILVYLRIKNPAFLLYLHLSRHRYL